MGEGGWEDQTNGFKLCSSSATCEVPWASHLTSEFQVTHVLSEGSAHYTDLYRQVCQV